MKRWLDVLLALLVASLVSIPMRAADSLSAARDLYAAAEYEDALALLNRLQPAPMSPTNAGRSSNTERIVCSRSGGRLTPNKPLRPWSSRRRSINRPAPTCRLACDPRSPTCAAGCCRRSFKTNMPLRSQPSIEKTTRSPRPSLPRWWTPWPIPTWPNSPSNRRCRICASSRLGSAI